jgi:hypothetical protein
MILKTSKGNEDFMNEVSSITKISHVNVVALLGFCFEGQKKALIYELMSNMVLLTNLFTIRDLEPFHL